MDQSEFRALLRRYQRNECTPEEKRRIEQWYSGLGSDRRLNLSADERAKLVATVWQRITNQSTAELPSSATIAVPPAGRQAWSWGGMRGAAAALLVIGASVGGMYQGRDLAKGTVVWHPKAQTAARLSSWVVYTNSTARPAAVTLPDGSVVTLTPASSLKYPRVFRTAQRTVYLTGEGFFNVFHDSTHPFLVFTDRVVTTVVGTSFTVQAFAGQRDVLVKVKTGKVRVAARGNASAPAAPLASLLLVPNQQAVYTSGKQLRREIVAHPLLLVPQPFVFNDRPVAEVLLALEKAYGVAIAYDAAALRNCSINLSLDDEPLFEKLDIICETLNASYEKVDGHILFHSQPCQAQ